VPWGIRIQRDEDITAAPRENRPRTVFLRAARKVNEDRAEIAGRSTRKRETLLRHFTEMLGGSLPFFFYSLLPEREFSFSLSLFTVFSISFLASLFFWSFLKCEFLMLDFRSRSRLEIFASFTIRSLYGGPRHKIRKSSASSHEKCECRKVQDIVCWAIK